ncbi:site-specific DNA-methyltransferase [Phascolarctobacterium sp.]|uniref:site-specific DNA-methyltransferase n=1 Tax=Phascolarctobacterium sp. TaxID=2049039 RepID=UPI00386ABDE3
MEKMRMESVDMTEQNIEKIAVLFLNCVTEVATKNGGVEHTINFDLLKQMLSKDVLDGYEAYEFTWVGKKAAIVEANKPIRKTLRPCVEESKNWDTTENLYIEGDNLEVLKLLQENYLNSIKMIYIDPPYNTGNDFIYNDDFKMTGEEYAEQSGEVDAEGNRMFKNTDSNGRFHSDWCSMIYSRLMLARNLLSDDGVIFISIDDNEDKNLQNICDEVFGGNNFVAKIVWEKVHTRKNSAINFSSSHEYIICYAKKKRFNTNDKEGFKRNLLPRDNTDAYSNPDNDPKGPWKTDPITAHNYYAADYSITKPNGVIITRPQDRYWAYSEATINKLIADKAIVWGEGNSMPLVKRYLCDVQNGLVPTTLFKREFAGDSSQAKKQLDELFTDCKGIFDYSKPQKLIQRLLQIGTNPDDIILDFFSGSATTAHAVMQLNAEDGSHRKFIMVQLPEVCDEKSEAAKAGYKNICEIGKERIRRAGEKIKEDNPLNTQDLDIGFRVLKVADSNMKDVYYSADEYGQGMLEGLESNIKEDRSDLDLLFGCLLDWGVPLNKPYTSEEIDGVMVHTYNEGDLVACFADNVPESVIKAIAARKPQRTVFRDSSFADSPSKINMFEAFKYYMPEDANDITKRVKVI